MEVGRYSGSPPPVLPSHCVAATVASVVTDIFFEDYSCRYSSGFTPDSLTSVGRLALPIANSEGKDKHFYTLFRVLFEINLFFLAVEESKEVKGGIKGRLLFFFSYLYFPIFVPTKILPVVQLRYHQ